MKKLVRALPLAILFTPALALAAGLNIGFSVCIGSCSGLAGLASTILNLINGVLVPLLFAVAFIVFLWGIADAYIFSHGEPAGVEKGHKLILWGLVGFVAMISLWGLVNVVSNTFGLSGFGAPPTPVSYPSY